MFLASDGWTEKPRHTGLQKVFKIILLWWRLRNEMIFYNTLNREYSSFTVHMEILTRQLASPSFAVSMHKGKQNELISTIFIVKRDLNAKTVL